MTDLRNQILESGKLSEEELNTKVQEKLKNLGGMISEDGALHIIANELGITSQTSADAPTVTVKDILPGMRNVHTVLKVVRTYELRTFGEDQQGKVASVYAGDATGFIRLTFWNDKTDYFTKIKEGDVIEVQQAYARENNNRTEIHMGQNSTCSINPEGKTIELPERNAVPSDMPSKSLSEINENDSMVQITATIVQAYDPRFFPIDPTTGQRTEEGPNVDYNYVMNLFVDDGTTNLRAAVWKEQVQELTGKSHEDILGMKDNQEALEQLKLDLLGTIISARAKVKKNQAYNNIEITLYNINTDPKPPAGEETKPEQSTSKPVPETKKETSSASSSPSPEQIVEADGDQEEQISLDDDDDLLSIDDIEEEL